MYLILLVSNQTSKRRSATKPNGQLGKRRGVTAIGLCSVSLVVSALIVLTSAFGIVHDLNASKKTAKEQTHAVMMSIVFPGGKLTLSNEASKVLMKAGLLPDNTLDNGAIPVSSANGKVYVGSQELDTDLVSNSSSHPSQEASARTMSEISDAIESLERQGIGITTDGRNITLRFKDGSTMRITEEDMNHLQETAKVTFAKQG